MAKDTHKTPKKPDKSESHRETQGHEAQAAPPKQRSQEVGGPVQRPESEPLAKSRFNPRPIHRPLGHLSEPNVPKSVQDQILALQQVVRSQSVLLVQYQHLLGLDGMAEPSSSDGDGEAEAA